SGKLIYSTCSDQVARPSKLDDATACSLFGIRPAAAASRPASTAWYIAVAMATGSCERLIAEASSTPSHPNSIASAASEAVPTPASRRIGTDAREQSSSILCGFKIPSPVPIGEPNGITAETPTSSKREATTGSSEVYASTVKPSLISCSQ